MIQNNNDVVFVLVGNKNDLKDKRQVTYEECEKFAKDKGMLFFEVSANIGKNIYVMFIECIKKLNKNENNKKNDDLDKKKSCCEDCLSKNFCCC